MMIALPILLYPLLILGMSRLQEGQQAAQTARNSRVALWGELSLDLEAAFKRNGRVEVMPWKSAPDAVRAGLEMGQLATPPSPPIDLAASDVPRTAPKIPDTAWAKGAQQALLKRDIDAVLILWPGFDAKVQAGQLGVVSILYDSVRPESGKARDRVSDIVRQYRIELQKQREKQRGLAVGFSTAVELQSQNLATEQRKSGMLIGMLLPYMLILFSAMSGFYAAIDMTAGEKERGTMETLLISPAERSEIVLGKFFAVVMMGFGTAVWNVLLMVVAVAGVQLFFPHTLLSLPGLGACVLAALPLAMLIAACGLALGVFARSTKEGNYYMVPLFFVALPLSYWSMTPGMELDGFTSWVPVANALLLQQRLMAMRPDPFPWQHLPAVVVSLTLCIAIALRAAIRQFHRESVLFREAEVGNRRSKSAKKESM
jgi:sodium transport system permease protein